MTEVRRNSLRENVDNILQNQDAMQKINVGMTLLLEIYRVLMGALLVSFVPQKCGDHICSPTENLYAGNGLYITGFVVNFLTLAAFVSLYVVEVKRENRMITYLEVNPHTPNSSESVGESLLKLPASKRENILTLDKTYQRGGYFVTTAFVFNSVLSAIVVFDNYLDSKTVTAYLTNVLFMAAKVNNVYTIANTDQNVFYSAYLTHKLQYNDVDPDKLCELDGSKHGDIEAMIDCPPERDVIFEPVPQHVPEATFEEHVAEVDAERLPETDAERLPETDAERLPETALEESTPSA